MIFSKKHPNQHLLIWAVVVAQLGEQSLPIPDVHSSNPVIGKFCSSVNYVETMKRNKKRSSRAHLKNAAIAPLVSFSQPEANLINKFWSRNSEIMQSDWLKQVTLLAASNHSASFYNI